MFWDLLRYTVIRESIRGGPGYDLAARRRVPQSQAGFSRDRDAPEGTLTLGLHREVAAVGSGARPAAGHPVSAAQGVS